MKVGILGGTGLVGGALIRFLDERSFPIDELRIFASSRSAGKQVEWKETKVTVEDAATADYAGLDVVLASAGAVTSRHLAEKIASQGAVVIDNSSCWRMDDQVPLVVNAVNDEDLKATPKGIVANPNCTTMAAMPVLAPLHRRWGLKKLYVATYQAVSGGGVAGLEELSGQIRRAASNENLEELSWDGNAVDIGEPKKFSQPIAFNVLAHAGSFVDEETDEEKKLRDESRKILHIPDLDVSGTCVRVPVFTGHSLAVTAIFDSEIDPEEAKAVLADSPQVELDDVPTPLKAAGKDPSYVGRVRRAGDDPKALALFIANDNLRKGAALNTVQLAESMLEQGLIGKK